MEDRGDLALRALLSEQVSVDFAFAHGIWLPAAIDAFRELEAGLDAATDGSRLAYLCERAQETIRAAGSSEYALASREIKRAIDADDFDEAIRIVGEALACLLLAQRWLERRCQRRRRPKEL